MKILINEIVEKNQEIIYNCTYDYDLYGNITSIERAIKTNEYANLPSLQTFTYNSYNELISYTVDGVTYQVSYNNGNPNKYKDFTITFTNGNLTSLINTDNNISYEYNADGIRIKKVVNGTTTLYKVYNGLIIEEEVLGNEGYKIQYLYDENNLLLGFIYNEETYYYQRTLTGEIVKIINSEGLVVGEYIYDAYGNILNISSLTAIAEINPYRYKGYYFDSETNLYYCKSRYYSPEIIRWISQDEIEYLDTSSVNGCNLYTYCNNNPIMYIDENGNIAKWLVRLTIVITVVVVALVCSVVATIVTVENQVPSGEELIKDDNITIINNENISCEIDSEGTEVNATWNESNQTWKIKNSYLINNEKDMYKFCEILYNCHKVPTALNSNEYRTVDDMVYEWQEHNKGYLYSTRLPDGDLKNRGLEATMHVDINPGDQGKNVYQLIWERIFS
ncbi:MAG: RHS repeat-associated core domain-containing protein [Bacilli bacterium]|nr:RHS repeat-associated core domain-containing protein [Bacilli bacterium]